MIVLWIVVVKKFCSCCLVDTKQPTIFMNYKKIFSLITIFLVVGGYSAKNEIHFFTVYLQGCSKPVVKPDQTESVSVEPDQQPVCPVGVKHLSDVKIKSSQSYSYSIDQGRLDAQNTVREAALREASNSYKIRIISKLKNSVICRSATPEDREICEQKIDYITELTSDNLIDKIETDYQDIGDNKICVTAIVTFSKEEENKLKELENKTKKPTMVVPPPIVPPPRPNPTESAMSYFNQGESFLNQKKYAQAFESFHQAIDIDKGDSAANHFPQVFFLIALSYYADNKCINSRMKLSIHYYLEKFKNGKYYFQAQQLLEQKSCD